MEQITVAEWWYIPSSKTHTDSFSTENIIINNTYIMWSFKIKYQYFLCSANYEGFGTLLKIRFKAYGYLEYLEPGNIKYDRKYIWQPRNLGYLLPRGSIRSVNIFSDMDI